MDRRKALISLGGSLGYVMTATTLTSLLQSCQQDQLAADWTPAFLTPVEGAILTQVVDLILPKTDTPGASEAGCHFFIDRFALEVMTEKQQQNLRAGIRELTEAALVASSKTDPLQLSSVELEPVLRASLQAKKPDISRIRDLSIMAYKSSELVGTKVLAYLPVPGEFVPCGDVQELTGGRAWSL